MNNPRSGEYQSAEQSLLSAMAAVMTYGDTIRQWAHAGSTPGVSKVSIYHHLVLHTFRVVGRNTATREVTLNSMITSSLRYNQATETFHQWRDGEGTIYGLNFVSQHDADNFAQAMLHALEAIGDAQRSPPPRAQPDLIQGTNRESSESGNLSQPAYSVQSSGNSDFAPEADTIVTNSLLRRSKDAAAPDPPDLPSLSTKPNASGRAKDASNLVTSSSQVTAGVVPPAPPPPPVPPLVSQVRVPASTGGVKVKPTSASVAAGQVESAGSMQSLRLDLTTELRSMQLRKLDDVTESVAANSVRVPPPGRAAVPPPVPRKSDVMNADVSKRLAERRAIAEAAEKLTPTSQQAAASNEHQTLPILQTRIRVQEHTRGSQSNEPFSSVKGVANACSTAPSVQCKVAKEFGEMKTQISQETRPPVEATGAISAADLRLALEELRGEILAEIREEITRAKQEIIEAIHAELKMHLSPGDR